MTCRKAGETGSLGEQVRNCPALGDHVMYPCRIFQMSHEINSFKETGSGQVTLWPEPSPEESLLAMTNPECTRGGSPCLQGMPGGAEEMCSSSSLPTAPGTPAHHSLSLGSGNNKHIEKTRIRTPTPASHSLSGSQAHV